MSGKKKIRKCKNGRKKGKQNELKIKADLVLLAMGFVHPIRDKLISDIGLELDQRGNVKANDNDYKTNIAKIFVSGDMRRGSIFSCLGNKRGQTSGTQCG